MLLPSALGFSPHPPVSVYGTGSIQTIAAFLDGCSMDFATTSSLRVTDLTYCPGLPWQRLLCLRQLSIRWLPLPSRVPTVLLYAGAGI